MLMSGECRDIKNEIVVTSEYLNKKRHLESIQTDVDLRRCDGLAAVSHCHFLRKMRIW